MIQDDRNREDSMPMAQKKTRARVGPCLLGFEIEFFVKAIQTKGIQLVASAGCRSITTGLWFTTGVFGCTSFFQSSEASFFARINWNIDAS